MIDTMIGLLEIVEPFTNIYKLGCAVWATIILGSVYLLQPSQPKLNWNAIEFHYYHRCTLVNR